MLAKHVKAHSVQLGSRRVELHLFLDFIVCVDLYYRRLLRQPVVKVRLDMLIVERIAVVMV